MAAQFGNVRSLNLENNCVTANISNGTVALALWISKLLWQPFPK